MVGGTARRERPDGRGRSYLLFPEAKREHNLNDRIGAGSQPAPNGEALSGLAFLLSQKRKVTRKGDRMPRRTSAARKLSIPEQFSEFISERQINLGTASDFYLRHTEIAAKVLPEHLKQNGAIFTCSKPLFEVVLDHLELIALDGDQAVLLSARLSPNEPDEQLTLADLLAAALYESVCRLLKPRSFTTPEGPEGDASLQVERRFKFTSSSAPLQMVVSRNDDICSPRLRIDIAGTGASELLLAIKKATCIRRRAAFFPLEAIRPDSGDAEIKETMEAASKVFSDITKQLRRALGLTTCKVGRKETRRGAEAAYRKDYLKMKGREIADRMCKDHPHHDTNSPCVNNFKNQARVYYKTIEDRMEALRVGAE